MATGNSAGVRIVELSEVGPHYQPTFESAAGDDSKVEDGMDGSRRKQKYNGGGKTRSTIYNVCNSDKDFDFSVFQQKRSDSWCRIGVSVGTRDLSYSVVKGSKLPCFGGRDLVRKQLLKDITLVVNPGEVTYVMGPSGAGKSTFLDTLAGRLKSGFMSGEMYFNGRPRSADFFDNSAYVRQDDVHIATLTVRETLRYAARLRIGTDYTVQEREKRVAAVAELLDLGTCMDCLVGDGALKGISGGQKKRLSIAVEILHMPSLIFLDEPTSGLDSVMSFEVMSFACKLSQQKRTILATIHQPSSETLMLSSKVIVLVAGRLAYCGPTEEIVTYFSSTQLRFPTDGYHNPAEYMLAVVSGLIESPIIGHAGDDPDKLSAAFRDSMYFEAPAMFKGHSQLTVSRPARFPTTITRQTLTLLERFWLTQIRDVTTVLLTIATRVGVALVFGAIFMGVGKVHSQPNFSTNSFNLASLMYLATFYVVACVVQIMPQISSFKVLYTREREANAYSTVAYWLTHCVVALPILLLAHVAWLEIMWWMIGLPRNPGVHLFVLFVLFVTHVCGWYMAQLISAVTPDATLALCLFPLVFVFMVAFSGFAIPFNMMPNWLVWITYLVFTRWCYEAVTMTIFSVRLDYKPVTEFFALGMFPRWTYVAILFAFLVGIALAVYFALLPKRSKLVVEQGMHVDDASGTKMEASVTHVAVPVMLQAQTTYTVKDFRAKSINRIPDTPGKTLLFKDFEYSVGRPPKVKPLLKGISGRVEGGEMCGLMGGSGAGKSTLLDVLAFRKTGGCTRGEYFIGGKAERPAGKWYSYVMQDNVHISVFTVRETLQFAAQLRLEEGVSTEKRNKRAENVMTMLGLEHVADVLVGDAWIKGISGGQARRLTIGVEIMQLPDVIFLDEPTTGLDSTTSYEVMAAVRNIADHRRTVVCTIHSPSESVFNLFDKLILLAAGRQTYYGDADAAVNYFTQPYFGWQMPVNKNPSDFIMLASEGMLGADGGKRMTIRDLSDAFMKQNSYREVSDAVALLKARSNTKKDGGTNGSGSAGGVSSGGTAVASMFSSNNTMSSKGAGNRMFARQDGGSIDHFKPVGARSLPSQMRILAWRQLCRLSKMRIAIAANIVKSIIVGLFHGVVYLHLSPDGIMQRLSLLFFAMMYTILACMTFIPEIFADRLLYYRERGSSVYGAFPYWLSSSIPFLPMTIISTWAYAQIMYYMCGLHPGGEYFGYFLLILVLDSLFGLYFCQFISFMMPSPDLGVVIFPSTCFIFVAFCGFVVSLESLPHWLKWATNASFARWSYQGLFVNEFKSNHVLIFRLPGFPVLKYEDWVYGGFAHLFGFDASFDKWKSVWVLVINLGAAWILSYIPFRFVSFEKR